MNRLAVPRPVQSVVGALEIVDEGMRLVIRRRSVELSLSVLEELVERAGYRIDQLAHVHGNRLFPRSAGCDGFVLARLPVSHRGQRMELTLLGRTGLSVSVAGLGCGGHSRLGLTNGGSEDQAIALFSERSTSASTSSIRPAPTELRRSWVGPWRVDATR